MTLARPVGSPPTGPVSLDRAFGRAATFACAGAIAALNAHADQIIASLRDFSVAVSITTLCGISAVIWVAMLAVLKIGFETDHQEIGRGDILVLIFVVTSSLLPIGYLSDVGLLACALYLYATSAAGTPSNRISVILLALTGPLIWGRLLLHVFATPILALDANFVGSLIGSRVDGNIVEFAGQNRTFLIGTPCSSVHNISLAIVLWATAAALFNLRPDPKYVLMGLAMIAWMFAMNIARLVAIGLFPADFNFLHAGGGAVLFGWAGLIGAGILVILGVTGAASRQR